MKYVSLSQSCRTSDGLTVAFSTCGEGPDVLLLHGFASSAVQNWRDTGWFRVLAGAGRRVVALDFRGHGDSDKPHDPTAFGAHLLADVRAVLGAVGITRCDVFGYSMGGSVALLLAAEAPQTVRRAILAGVGASYLERPLPADSIAAALEAAEKKPDDNQLANRFRLFADQSGKDRLALAACVRALPPRLPRSVLAGIRTPILVMCGDRDGIAGMPEPLAATFPQGESLRLAGRDHMTAVGDLTAKRAVVAFLNRS